jgi:predicted AlkP superfamily pyrophosphatase or phosphodiesterase
MKNISTSLAAICFTFFSALLSADSGIKSTFAVEEGFPVVIMISMDGMRHDYLDRASFPALKRMEQEGFRAVKMLPTFPSNTFVGHVSLATGALPEMHGIIDNQFYDKEKGFFSIEHAAQWLEAEPLWISTVRQKKRSAVYYWVGSEAPWKNQQATYYKSPFQPMSSEAVKVDQIIQWLDLPYEQKPQLIMSYWHGADRVGHLFGPENKEVTNQIHKQDQQLQRLQKALDERNAWNEVTLIVVSDHGMTATGKIIDLADIFSEGKIKARITKSNAIAHVHFFDQKDVEKGYQYLKQQKKFDSYYPRDVPESFRIQHKTRSGDLVLLAKDGYRFSNAGFYDFSARMKEGVQQGMHGLSPHHPDMATIFLAQGRGIKKGSSLPEVKMIDVAATISFLLNMEAPLQSTGKSFLPIGDAVFGVVPVTYTNQ